MTAPAYVFLGPTLPREQAHELLDAVVLPPAAQGDVYRVARTRPSLIGIVDGTFERMPSVWHKEILWAMDQGIPVLGAASMGALRAAELAAFGMEGVGEVFAAFRDGLLKDDDEVAVAHGLAEDGFRTLSEAMVNVRATVAAAVTAGVVDEAAGASLIAVAKARFYPERRYPTVLADAVAAGVAAAQVAAFGAFLPTGRVERKREDAVALLERMRQRLDDGDTTIATDHPFETTTIWAAATRAAGQLGTGDEVVGGDRLLDELRLDPDTHAQLSLAADQRLRVVAEAGNVGHQPDEAQLWEATDRFRLTHGLIRSETATRWMEVNDLDHTTVERLMREQALLAWSRRRRQADIAAAMPDELRLAGRYPEVVDRLRDKEQRLTAAGFDAISLADTGLSEDELFDWYVDERLDGVRPPDLASFRESLGFVDAAHLREALLREYAYTVILAPLASLPGGS